MPQGHNHHENKRDKRNERLLKMAKHSKGVAILDRPMPIIDLGEEKISLALREIIDNDHEDTFQDAWVKILEENPSNLDGVRKIARECSKRNTSERIKHQYKTRSADVPLNDEPNSATLIEILPAKPLISDLELEAEIKSRERYAATHDGRINVQGNVRLDLDVYQAVKTRFPHDPLNHAIRKLANLPPPTRQKLGWHKWEDEIIKVRYPWGGSRAVMLDVNRTESAIITRAKKLGVLRGKLNGYKPCPDWLNIREVSEMTGRSWQTIERYINEGVIKAIRIPDYHQGHDGVFVTPQALDDYKNRKDIIKQERMRRRIAATLKKVAENRLSRREENIVTKEARLKEWLKEQKVILREQKVILREQKAEWLKEQKVILREQKVILREQKVILREQKAEWNRIVSKEEEFATRESELNIKAALTEKVYLNYQMRRKTNLNKAIVKLKSSPKSCKTARKGNLTHYVFLRNGDLFSLCRPNDYPLPVETIVKFNYDPFVEGAPTCSKCLNISKVDER